MDIRGEHKDRGFDFEVLRRRMVARDLMGRGICDEGVLRVMGEVRREEFVPEEYREASYADGSLPIGIGQTISQPYIVGLMSEYLEVDCGCEVLEIGTGCGYQTAILAKLAKRVYTVERFNELSELAQANLARVGVSNVEFYVGDGSCGWCEWREFDRIIVTAAAPGLEGPLVEQLKEGGKLIAPVGGRISQNLVVCTKRGGQLRERVVCGVRFVPLVGEYGFSE
jgi:protein-L-isoaspartate(D-aspartate) O-methyltransferase